MLIRSGDSRSKSKVVKNRAEFRTILCPPNFFVGGGLPNFVPTLSPLPRGTLPGLGKFRENTSTIPEIIDSNTLNFGANFKFSRLKFLGDPGVPGVCASKPWSISSACTNLRAQHPLRAEM